MTIYLGSAQCGVAILLAILLTTPRASAHVDMIAPLTKVEKVYAAPKPLGKLRATYTSEEDGKKPALVVECEAFRASVPEIGLEDLPRPDWSSFSVAYSLTSFESGKWVERPYLYLKVTLHGPPGRSWEQTWATFHFDADGKLTRRIKRFIPNEATNSIRSIWKEWEIGSGVSAEILLESAKDE